ncbi:MAG: hypothetical protein ABIG66_03825 [Candidatus Kerfeldbacteria bacterium]
MGNRNKFFVIIIAVVAIFCLAGGFAFWYTSPKRVLNNFLHAVEFEGRKSAMLNVSTTIKADKRDNIDFFVEDWTSADDVIITFEKDESWKSRPLTETDENGNDVPVINEHGNEALEKVPVSKYWAHHYAAYATIAFEDYEDPVIIKMKRQTEDTWGFFSQLFRAWKITNISFQPWDDLDYEAYDESADEDGMWAEDADSFEFEIDEEGNLIVPADEGEEGDVKVLDVSATTAVIDEEDSASDDTTAAPTKE